MEHKTGIGAPEFPAAVPNVSDEINRNIIRSGIEGGVHLSDLPEGAELEVRTENRDYRLVNYGGHQVMIAGHPEFCPEPVRVQVNGSSWGGSWRSATSPDSSGGLSLLPAFRPQR